MEAETCLEELGLREGDPAVWSPFCPSWLCYLLNPFSPLDTVCKMRTKCLLLLGLNKDKGVGAGCGSVESVCLRQHRALASMLHIAHLSVGCVSTGCSHKLLAGMRERSSLRPCPRQDVRPGSVLPLCHKRDEETAPAPLLGHLRTKAEAHSRFSRQAFIIKNVPESPSLPLQPSPLGL